MARRLKNLLDLKIFSAFLGCGGALIARPHSARDFKNSTDALSQQCGIKIKECAELSGQNIKEHDNLPWVCKKSLSLRETKRLPEKYNLDIEFQSASPLVLKDWFLWLSNSLGVSSRLTPDAEAKLLGQYKIEVGKNQGSAGKNNQNNARDESLSDPLLSPIFRQKYKGSVEGCLDFLSSEIGLSWRYDDDKINFYFLDTKTFKIHVIPSSTKISSTMNVSASTESNSSADSNVSSGSGQSSQSTSVETTTDILADIAKNIETIITPGIGRYSLSTSTGYLTVTDTEEGLTKIADYINRENACITKQVLLNVKVITVELEDSNQSEINWKIVFDKLNATLGGVTGLVKSSLFNIDNLKLGGQSGVVYDFLNGKLGMDSIGLFINLLSEQGKVSVLTSPSVTTLNLQPVPLQVAQQQNYLARQITNVSSDGLSSTTIESGTVTSGLSMNLLPFITEDNQILLQYSINLSDLVGIETISSSSGGESDDNLSASSSKIQLPTIDNRIFTQKVRMRSGQTLLLAGYEQQKGANKGSSPLPWVSRFWGSNSSSQEHKSTIILITPIILE